MDLTSAVMLGFSLCWAVTSWGQRRHCNDQLCFTLKINGIITFKLLFLVSYQQLVLEDDVQGALELLM